MSLRIRCACYEDLDSIIKVEENWPENERAPLEKFLARLEKFPQGFFVSEFEGRIYGTMTSCLVHYEPSKPHLFQNWDEVTNHGYLYEIGAVQNLNALYIVSGVVDKRFWWLKIFDALVKAEVNLAKNLGLRYVTAGAVMPGYNRYCKKHGEIEAQKYVFLKQGERCVDPFLETYRRLGFSVPDEKHVIKDYYPDAASRHYAALVVHRLEEKQRLSIPIRIAMNRKHVIKTNQEAWDEVASIHKKYHYNRLLKRFKRPGYSCIGGIKQDIFLAHGIEGKAVFQPCCNNGRDLLSIKNLGAKRCVGFDLSSEFIEHGKEFAAASGIECELIHADVYKLDKEYDGQFDIAYITSGTLVSLPDLDGFFAVVSRLMRPGAWLFMQEIHPILDMYGMEPSKRLRWLRLRHSYFMKESYIAKKGLDYYRSRAYRAKPCYFFHHKLSDIIQAIVNSRLIIETFEEHDNDTSGGRFKKLKRRKIRLPLIYIITANRL